MIDALRQWAFTLVLTAVVGSLAVAVSNSPNIKKYIKFTCALVALAVMIAPLSSLFSGLPDIFRWGADNPPPMPNNEFHFPSDFGANPEEILNQEMRYLIADKSELLLRQRISILIEQKSGIKPTDIYIYSTISNNLVNSEADIHGAHIEIEKIVVTMPVEMPNPNIGEEIQEHLQQITGSEVVIEIIETMESAE